jgi:Leucine-rich repeat (LRR) protein
MVSILIVKFLFCTITIFILLNQKCTAAINSSITYKKFPHLNISNTSITMKIKPNSFIISNQVVALKPKFDLDMLVETLFEYCQRFPHKTNQQFVKEECFFDVETLDFSSNKLTHFPSNLTKQMLKHVKHIDLSSNSIQNLSSQNDFATMLARNTIETLDLSSNYLTSIDEETFKHLRTLKHLNLANNKIKFINLFAFADDTHNLVQLDLSKNLIVDTSMEFLLFSSLTKLKYLNMDHNKLTTLSNHLLYNLYSLEHLSLSRNNLKTFDLFSLTKNNEFLKVIDLSFNFNLKIDHNTSDKLNTVQMDEGSNVYMNNVEVLDMAGVDLTYANMNTFFNSLFDQFKMLKHVNVSLTRIKSMWSSKWPHQIELIDLSHNFIDEFDCSQFASIYNLTSVSLSNNRLSSFKKFLDSCSIILERNHSIKFDLSNNLFESIDSISSTAETQVCTSQSNLSSLILHGNPLVCDCEENTWWSHVDASASGLFHVTDKTYCVKILEYEKLSCSSVSESKLELLNENLADPKFSTEAFLFEPIRNGKIAPILLCPYKYSCSTKTCECCGFRACDCSFHCPSLCKCTRDYAHTFDMVNCTNVNLSIMPTYLPTSTTEILLDNNGLKRIQPYQFFGRFRLKKIDLSQNQLAFIEENSFHGLTQLTTLSLSNNHLQILLGYEFKDLYQLEYLHLDHNRIQFISNVTFSNLLNLKYLSLQHNSLRHLLEREFYFQFNLNMVNLTLDTIDLVKQPEPDNRIKLIESLTHNKFQATVKNIEKIRVHNNRLSPEKKLNNMTYFSLIKKMLNTRATSFLIECIFDKFKELAESQANLSFSEMVSLNLNTKTSDEHVKVVLLRHFKRLKFECNQTNEFRHVVPEKTFRTREQPPFKLVSSANTDDDFFTDDYEINDGKLKEEEAGAFFRLKSSFIVLNYTTIFWCFFILVLSILFLSVLFSYFIIKFQQKKRERKSGSKLNKNSSVLSCIRKKILKVLNRFGSDGEKSEREMTQSVNNSNQRYYNKHQNKYLLDNPKLKSKKFNKIKVSHHKSSVTSNENSESTRSISIGSSFTKIYDETLSEACSNKTSGYFHSHVWEKDFFQLKTDCNSMDQPIYDLFLVYNKADRDLVENVIGPILQSKPYNYKISLQHNTNIHNNPTSTQELMPWSHHNRANYYNLNLIEQFIDLISASSFVLFVLSKNLFTELEYRLSIETPKHKKLVLLADDIHDSIAENLLQPGQIFRGNFNMSDQQRKSICFDDHDKNMNESNGDTRILKLTNRLSSNEINSKVYSKQKFAK